MPRRLPGGRLRIGIVPRLRAVEAHQLSELRQAGGETLGFCGPAMVAPLRLR